MRLLVFIFCAVLFSCSNDSSSPVLYDGIYQTKVLENENTGDTYRYFLKFYEDGTVIGVTSSGTADDIRKWFKKGHENVTEGEYEVEEDEISFTLTSPYAEVEYTGTIKDKEKLILNSSADNGKKDKFTYSFVEN